MVSELLTPLDLLMPRTYVGALLTFRTTQSPEVTIQHLQRGLDKLVVQLPWLSGAVFPTVSAEGKPWLEMRYQPNEATINLINKGSITASYVQSCDDGMPPETAHTDVWPLPMMIDEETYQSGARVSGFSIFQFGDRRGVGLCICIHHNVVDGVGFGELIKMWANCLVGDFNAELSSQGTSFKRLSEALAPNLRNTRVRSANALMTLHPEFSPNPPTLPTEFAQNACKIVKIHATKIDQVKVLVESCMGARPSTNTVITALLWIAITTARSTHSPTLKTEVSNLVTAVNGRRRISETLGDTSCTFFGNIVLYAMSKMPVQELIKAGDSGADKSLAEVCAAILTSQSTGVIDAEFIAEVYSLVESSDNYAAIFPG